MSYYSQDNESETLVELIKLIELFEKVQQPMLPPFLLALNVI